MSYGRGASWEDIQLSECAAEWLNVSRYFNTGQSYFNEPSTIEMLPPLINSSNAIDIQFNLTDPDLLHQAQLMIPVTADDSYPYGSKLYNCRLLDNESGTISFTIPDSTAVIDKSIWLRVIDMLGNITISNNTINKNDVITPRPDVNADGVVNVLDLVLIASHFENTDIVRDISSVDVNMDGAINVLDLILVSNAMNE